jgi:hypothetical protein
VGVRLPGNHFTTVLFPVQTGHATFSFQVIAASKEFADANLNVVRQGGVINASGQPSSVGSVAPISYLVEGCYSLQHRAGGNACEPVATTSDRPTIRDRFFRARTSS